MATALLILMLLLILATDLRRVLLSGNKKLAWFYCICFATSFVVLVLSSLGKEIYGPSQLVRDIAKALYLIEQ